MVTARRRNGRVWSALAIAGVFAGGAWVGSAVAGGDEPTMEEMMKAWAEASAPGEPHARLMEMAGEYDVEGEFFMAPGAPGTKTTAKATYSAEMGGRFLVLDYRSDWQGQEMIGRGITGFDNGSKMYQSVWLDNSSTGMIYMTGTADDAGMVTWHGTMTDPMTKQEKKMKAVERHRDGGMEFEMFDLMPDGSEFKTMTLVYTRRGVTKE